MRKLFRMYLAGINDDSMVMQAAKAYHADRASSHATDLKDQVCTRDECERDSALIGHNPTSMPQDSESLVKSGLCSQSQHLMWTARNFKILVSAGHLYTLFKSS